MNKQSPWFHLRKEAAYEAAESERCVKITHLKQVRDLGPDRYRHQRNEEFHLRVDLQV